MTRINAHDGRENFLVFRILKLSDHTIQSRRGNGLDRFAHFNEITRVAGREVVLAWLDRTTTTRGDSIVEERNMLVLVTFDLLVAIPDPAGVSLVPELVVAISTQSAVVELLADMLETEGEVQDTHIVAIVRRTAGRGV